MDDLKATRMAGLEAMRVKAFSLGGPLGHLLSKSFDLIQTVVRDGVQSERANESLAYSLESLARERDLAMSRDMDKDDPLRHLVYGLAESMGTMVESILEEKQQMEERSKQEWQQASAASSTLPYLEYPFKDEAMDDPAEDPAMNTQGDAPGSSSQLANPSPAGIARPTNLPCSSNQPQITTSTETAGEQNAGTVPTTSATDPSVQKGQEETASSDQPPAKRRCKTSLVGFRDDDDLEESEEVEEEEDDEDWHPQGDEAAAEAAASLAAIRKKRGDRGDRQFIDGSDMEEGDDDWQPDGDDEDAAASTSLVARRRKRADRQRIEASDIDAEDDLDGRYWRTVGEETSSSGRKRARAERTVKQSSPEADLAALHLRERCRICHKSVAQLAVHMAECHESSRPKRTCKPTGTFKSEDVEDEEQVIRPSRPKRHSAAMGMYKEEDEEVEEEEDDDDNETVSSVATKPAASTSFACAKCDRVFDSSRGMNIHARTCKGKVEEKLEEKTPATPAVEQCPFQKTEVKARISLTPGTSSATPARPYGCPHCQLDRLSLNMLNHHLRTYHDLKPYECNVCDEKFARKRELKAHREKEGHEKIIVVD